MHMVNKLDGSATQTRLLTKIEADVILERSILRRAMSRDVQYPLPSTLDDIEE